MFAWNRRPSALTTAEVPYVRHWFWDMRVRGGVLEYRAAHVEVERGNVLDSE